MAKLSLNKLKQKNELPKENFPGFSNSGNANQNRVVQGSNVQNSTYGQNDSNAAYDSWKQQKKKALIVLLAVLGGVVLVSTLIYVFVVIKPINFSNNQTTVSADKTESSSSNNNNNNNNNNKQITTKALTCTSATGSTLSGTVNLKDGNYVIPDSSSKSYTAAEISAMNLNDAELCIAWNEPYARAGYHFKNSGLRDYFNSMSWYHDTGFSGTLSDTGGQNTNVIKSVAGSSPWKNLATY